MKTNETVTAAEIVDQAGVPKPQSKFGDDSDAGLADRMIADGIGDYLMMVTGLGWYGYNGKKWKRIATTKAVDFVRIAAESILDAMDADVRNASSADEKIELRSQVLSMSYKLGSHTKLKGVLGLLAGRLTRQAEELDAHPELLCCENGVLNLRTGELSPHDPKLLMTKCTGTAYVPGATSPVWDQVREAISDPETEVYLQRRAGHETTGHAASEAAFLIGDGENGKSGFVDAKMYALGDYAGTLAATVIGGKGQGDRHPTEIADLQGLRLALIEETPDGHHLDVAALKRIIATAKIRARRMGQDFFEFPATHDLIVCSNFRPAVSETDRGSWRRLLEIVFPYTFVSGKPERPTEKKSAGDGMKRALATQRTREAVLAWMVEGAKAVLADDGEIGEPSPAVAESTAAWRAESDVLGTALTDITEESEHGFIPTAEVMTVAKRLLRKAGMRAPRDTTIKERLRRIPGWDRLDQDRITVGKGGWEVSTRTPPRTPYSGKIRGLKGFMFASGKEVEDDDF